MDCLVNLFKDCVREADMQTVLKYRKRVRNDRHEPSEKVSERKQTSNALCRESEEV